nr:DUF3089 domain-containing protein [Micromonospora sp. DSM 115978]
MTAACSDSDDTGSEPDATSTASGAAAAPVAFDLPVQQPTLWLCHPDEADPCEDDLTATVLAADGTTSEEPFTPAEDPPIDCFYVYPTVSSADGVNAPLEAEPAAVRTVKAQAARFGEVCKVYAPVYRQLTLNSRRDPAAAPAGVEIATADVVSAWNEYLNEHNDGRGVVLIGHSQGAGQLNHLLATQIEEDPAQLGQVVSALLIGGNVEVSPGGRRGRGAASPVPPR